MTYSHHWPAILNHTSDTNTPLQRETTPTEPLVPPQPLLFHFLPQTLQDNRRLVGVGLRD